MKLISIVIPAFNEEEVLNSLSYELTKVMRRIQRTPNSHYDFEVIIVDNGSTDKTFDILKEINKFDNRFKIVRLSRNFGMDGGITAGLKYASGQAVVIMNADLQDPPQMIPEFIQKWEEGNEIVYGIIKKRRGVPFWFKVTSGIFYKIVNRLSGGSIPENVSDFRLIDRKVLDVVNGMEERNRFLRGIVAWTGFKQVGVKFVRPARAAGETKFSMMKLVKYALNGIFSFSYFPLKFVTVLGVFVAIVSFLMGAVEVGIYLRDGRVVPGFTSIILVMLFLFGVLFFILGVIGEYLARIYDEVKMRPNYIVKEVVF